MAYQPNNGQFSLFKNDKKTKDTQPDYRGDGLSPDGTPVWVSAWVKDGSKGKFFSCSMQVKEDKPAKASNDDVPFDDTVPF